MTSDILGDVHRTLTDRMLLKFVVDLIIQKLGKSGVRITSREKEIIQDWVEKRCQTTLKLFEEEQGVREVKLELTPRDRRRLKGKLLKSVSDGIGEIVTSTLQRVSPSILGDVKADWKRYVRGHRKDIAKFEQRLSKRWKEPFELLELQIGLAREIGVQIHRNLKPEGKRWPPFTDAIIRLHARACRTAAEADKLIRSGYADGAMARWRTLHEIVITAALVHRGGRETAERYLEHLAVESYRAACEYARCAPRLGHTPIADEELRSLKDAFDAMIAKHGAAFGTQYGWAAKDLKLSKPTFADIEKAVNFEHFRPYYKLASHGVHANPKGIYFQLGMMDHADIIMVGPTNFGLADPGQNTAISLMQISCVLIQLAPTIDTLILCQLMGQVATEAGIAFLSVQKKIEEDETALAKRRGR